MKFFIAVALAVLAFNIQASAQDNPPLEGQDLGVYVLTRYYRAQGGDALMKGIMSSRLIGEISCADGSGSFPFRFFKRRPDLMRFEFGLSVEETWVTAVTEEVVWKGVRHGGDWLNTEIISDPTQRLHLSLEAEFDNPLWTLREQRRTAAISVDPANPRIYLATVTPRDTHAEDIRIEMKIDARDFLERERKLTLPDGSVIVVKYGDYQQIDGLPVPFKTETLVDGKPVSTVELTEAALNIGTLKVFFDLPK